MVAVATILVLAGCSSHGKSKDMVYKAGTQVTSHLTYQEAQAQLHENLKQSLRALPAGAKLSLMAPDIPLPCSDSDGAPPSTPVSIESSNWLEGLPESGNRHT